jgi:uncharacterized short protein YbdD (DUF466 family)
MDSVNSSSSASISASVSVMNEQRRASLQPTLINATMANPNTILNAFDNMDVDQSFASTQIPTPLATSHNGGGASLVGGNQRLQNDDQRSTNDELMSSTDDHRSHKDDKGHHHKLVKIPEWKQKLFRNGDDIDTHLYNFKNQLERIPGLTNEQISHYLLDSLSPDVKVVAQSMHRDIGVPSYSNMVILLRKSYPRSRTLIYENFEDQIGSLNQSFNQTLSSYIANVQNILNLFKQSQEIFDKKRYYKLEEMAFHALSLRLNKSDQRRLEDQKRLWLEKGRENPMLLSNRYETLLIRLVQMSQEDGNAICSSEEENKPNGRKDYPECTFGDKCTRKNCKFGHSKSKGKSKGVSKKEVCKYCKKPGHKEEVCYSKKNKEKREAPK